MIVALPSPSPDLSPDSGNFLKELVQASPYRPQRPRKREISFRGSDDGNAFGPFRNRNALFLRDAERRPPTFPPSIHVTSSNFILEI